MYTLDSFLGKRVRARFLGDGNFAPEWLIENHIYDAKITTDHLCVILSMPGHSCRAFDIKDKAVRILLQPVVRDSEV